MIEINNLIFMFLVEFLVIFFGLAIFFFYKSMGRLPGGRSKDNKRFIFDLERELETLEEESKTLEENAEAESDSETIIAREINAAKLHILHTALATAQTGKVGGEALWDDVYARFSGIVRESITQTLEQVRNGVPQGSFGSQGDSGRVMQSSAATKKRFIIELLSHKEMVSELEKELAKLREFNQRLIETLNALPNESSQQAASEIVNINVHVDKLIKIIKQETKILGRHIANYEHIEVSTQDDDDMDSEKIPNVYGGSDQDKDKMQKVIKSLESNIELLTKKIQDLEADIARKDSGYKKLQKEFGELDIEYKRVYDRLKTGNADGSVASADTGALEANLAEKDAEIKKLQKELDDLNVEFERLYSESNPSMGAEAASHAKIKELEAELSEKEAQNKKLQKELDDLNVEFERLYSESNPSLGAEAASHAKIKELEEELERKDKAFDELQKQFNAMKQV
ncbi:MAG: hypothetical protein HQL05_06870 [Nitrospirae bacterium]|uniref:hypothetical protein n=1 Tax=Candidatus Magnetobacterium casense TaxID=1455061 RepID=UPI00058B3078|nr:hypothetical protein [Candidatus Magnetobacterium casensis]MBF0337541.1 hypothetical protein [Nitrospirota bacterium]